MSRRSALVRWAHAAAGTAALCAVGCASSPPETPPPLAVPQAFSVSGSEAMPERWWTAFGDPALDRLVESALASNLDLESVWHRLREVRAVADREAANLYPDVDAFADAEVRRPERDGGDQIRLGLAAAYEVDLWGRVRSRADAERLRATATLSDYRAAALTLSAEVARTWFELVEAHDQLVLLDRQIGANERVLASLEVRFAGGRIRAVDVLRQQQLVEATREQRVVQEARVGVLRHLMAVLLGRAPGDPIGERADGLPTLPPLPATGVPAELVQRRPDVRAAYRRLQAADHDLAAAVSDRYPRLDLTASVTTVGDDAGDLFDGWIRSLAGGLVAPLFRGGELAAEVDRSEAVRATRLSEYGQATLVAIAEVEDALVLEEKEEARVASLERQVELADQSTRRLEMQYLNGLGDFIDVLVAQASEQRLRRDLLAARRLLLEHRIALYRALAGGFDTAREAAPRLVATDAAGPTGSNLERGAS